MPSDIAACATHSAICWARSKASTRRSGSRRRRCRRSSAGFCIDSRNSTAQVRRCVEDFDFDAMFTAVYSFCDSDLSAFYFDVRKDALYCDRPDEPAPPRRAHGVRPCLQLPRHLARADPLLHGRGSLAVPQRPHGERVLDRQRASPHLPGGAAELARRRAGGEVDQDPRSCAAWSPARWSWSARTSASAPACRPIRRSSPTAPTSMRSPASISRKSPSPRRRPCGRARRRPARSLWPTCRMSAVVVELADGEQMRALLARAAGCGRVTAMTASAAAAPRRSARARRRSSCRWGHPVRGHCAWVSPLPSPRCWWIRSANGGSATCSWIRRITSPSPRSSISSSPGTGASPSACSARTCRWRRGSSRRFAVAIVIGLGIWLSRLTFRWPAIALGLIIGGALGNVMDRLRFAGVFDFLWFHGEAYPGFCRILETVWLGGFGCQWPAFNLADTGIFIGVAMLVLDGLFRREEKSKTAP